MTAPSAAGLTPGSHGRDRLAEPLRAVVGTKTATALAKLGLETVGDLLRHYPRRYDDPSRLTDLADLPVGDHVTVFARTKSTGIRPMRGKSGFILSAVITDGHRDLDLTFFGKNRGILAHREHMLRPGRTGLFTGTIGEFRGKRQLTHPDYLFPEDAEERTRAAERATLPTPIYPASGAIPSWGIRAAVETVLDTLREEDVPDPLPEAVRAERGLPGLLETLRLVHAPRTAEDWQAGQERMRFEEAFVLQAALAQRRAEARAQPATARAPRPGGILDAFDARLPFSLTAGQQEVGATVAADLARTWPMQRMLQGEVGSGKTVVALRAMLQVVDAGGQAALLAPTEVLAAQHARTISAMLGPLAEAGMLGGADRATRVTLVTGSLSAPARRAALAQAASGEAGIVVGTHALLSQGVQFADLGLVVVDEQHRFGVEQRDALRAKATHAPHLLVMTATPIPRTVAMTVFGDLEISTLREVPAGRAGVRTHLVPLGRPGWLERAWQRLREQVDDGARGFVLCPRITAADDAVEPGTDLTEDVPDEDGAGDAGGGARGARGDGTARAAGPPPRPLAAVDDIAARLRAMPLLAGVPVGELHGRLPADERDATMAAFAGGAVPVLVTTTVIEVGVDVPDATIMIILDADRFGLSQLHQLRGRIGRGTRPGTCLAVTSAPPGSPAMERLEAFAATTDGFELARVDLAQRREGDVLGAAQSGRGSSLRLLRVLEDADIIDAARGEARALVDADPTLAAYPVLARTIAEQLDPERAEFLDRT
ncbi:ATP-dependent DNA helicase RecG [Georgenia faecalis]|uniref:ATP-dependent DNA helicase RecG n=1 Tax=Georgenia faecalis TaxID=2483799 RepID=UPI000FD99A34|nr:ATP-dependent DNA helicase RecG [Georgenia faecalis]